MKTRTNFQKAAIRSAAVVISFVLISITVSAQEFWKKLLINSSFNEIAIAMVETDAEKSTTKNSATTGIDWNEFDRAFDTGLELEGWMSSEEHFGVTGFQKKMEVVVPAEQNVGTVNLGYEPDTNEPLVLEDWMVQGERWVR